MAQNMIRTMVDTVGFATKAEQMDKVMERIEKDVVQSIQKEASHTPGWRLVISPHDDYTYVGQLYPELLKNVTAKTVIIFGVAHFAQKLGVENYLIFDTHTHWEAPYGNVKVSPIREEIIQELPKDVYQINDNMQKSEHSVEAIVPFLQYFNRNIEIVSILVPHMTYDRTEQLSKALAEVIGKVVKKNKWEWGKDFAIVVSSDAVHYGDEDWGGQNFARFGTDTEGYQKAVKYEYSIIEECFQNEITPEKMKALNKHTLNPANYKIYNWTWCGRYSIPCGVLTSYHLQQFLSAEPLKGKLVSYGTSFDGRKHIPVDDLGMGVTAPAKLRHWVGYASIGYV
eukprot:TRINITY_DN14736_c0_g1_i1.p1 TRINITY_DN14736_c0_g1~~TRINITY_DN14736_c0_g1_i1.p1  ORF type:complete len:340 (+),score=57.84 TRINITY_DN14736_c0_g1_i1:84-1103(+)